MLWTQRSLQAPSRLLMQNCNGRDAEARGVTQQQQSGPHHFYILDALM